MGNFKFVFLSVKLLQELQFWNEAPQGISTLFVPTEFAYNNNKTMVVSRLRSQLKGYTGSCSRSFVLTKTALASLVLQ